jgi:ribosomal-protein-serine acetyltransferase
MPAGMSFRRVLAPGVELRLLQEEDAEPLFEVVQLNRAYLRQWLPWVDRTITAADPLHFIRESQAAYERGDRMDAAIWVEGELAGCIGHHAIDHANRSVSLGYWIAQAHEGNGIITRSCHLLLDYLFDERALHRVEIRCGTGNTRSCAVPQRLGFRREGVSSDAQWVNDRWVDLVIWGMLEHEWRKQ